MEEEEEAVPGEWDWIPLGMPRPVSPCPPVVTDSRQEPLNT